MENLNHPLPSKEEIILWNAGNFPAGERKNQIAFLLENDPFIANAFEGAALDKDFNHLPPTVKIPIENGSFKNHFLGWGIGLVAGALMGIGVFLSSSETSKNADVQENVSISSQQEKKTTSTPEEGPTQNDHLEPKKENNISKEKELQSKKNLGDNNSTPTQEIILSKEANTLLAANPSSLKPVVKTITVSDQKVYPYQERIASESTFNWENVHVNAEFENKNEQERNLEKNRQLSYIKYLEQALEAFNLGQWQQASDMFDVILSHYPDDVNALYFKGQTLFNQGNKTQAKQYFTLVQEHTIHVFEKEAKEFIRLCL